MSHLGDKIINTRSNLNSDVLREICFVCDFDPLTFANDDDFIDRILLKRRNEIAHGEESFVDAVDIEDVTSRTSEIMRKFRDLADNAIAVSAYRALAGP